MNGNSFWTIQLDVSVLAGVALCFMPVVWAFFVIRRTLDQRRAKSKPPFDELKRRPAGEAVRLKVASLDDQINDLVLLLVAVPSATVLLVMLVKPHGLIMALVLLAISGAWVITFTRKLLRALEDRRKYQLGFDGERYVGEELSRLIALGFEVYHDVPFDGFNIDHVLVGSQGVFVVETKTRRKPVNKAGGKEYHVIFDGKSLQWPWGTEEQDIRQTINCAKTISKWLSQAVGEQIHVSALLTLPGWWVDLAVPCQDFHVLNPKQIIQVCASKEKSCDETMVKRICFQLDQKCRVEIK